MKSALSFMAWIALLVPLIVPAQDSDGAAPDQSNQAQPPVEIVSFKISSDYHPMLDRKNSEFTADNPDFPRPEVERMGSPGARRRGRIEDVRAQGKLRSHIKVISEANWVNLTIKNTEAKTIKAVAWDFAFPRYVEGQMALRYGVTSKVEIKPGGKKTLKHKLPPGAKRCEVVKVVSDEDEPEKVNTFEAVCGQGFHDLSLLKQKQETMSIKRVEYVDGSVWQRP
jgi:hypothetical protein